MMLNHVRYIYFKFDKEEFLIEIGEDGYALRQIIISEDNQVHLSCFEDCLAEGDIKELAHEFKVSYITSTIFNNAWDKYTLEHRKKWEVWKTNMELGKEVKGKVLYHYPQGWILQIGSMMGVYDIDRDFQVGQIVNGYIVGFDDINMWSIIGKSN